LPDASPLHPGFSNTKENAIMSSPSSSGLSRRHFLGVSGAVALLAAARGTAATRGSAIHTFSWNGTLDVLMRSALNTAHIPGAAIAIIDGGELVRAAGFGWADLSSRQRMTAATLINVASCTKPVTATAVMQLVARGQVQLDADINRYLPFRVTHPVQPGARITVRDLLTHMSGIADGPAYAASYHCGDVNTTLAGWLRSYLTRGGARYDASNNFNAFGPGVQWQYSNIGFGLLGLLIESVAHMPYEAYLRTRVLEPLGMRCSQVSLAGLNAGSLATPYTYVDDGNFAAVPLIKPRWLPTGTRAQQVPHCQYSFATPPDGLLRTSAAQFARFLMATLNDGAIDGNRILPADVVQQMLADQSVRYPVNEPGPLQGLAWVAQDAPENARIWFHTGSDPGVASVIALRRSDRRALVLLANSNEDQDNAEAFGAIVDAVFTA
jgi:CubicO group peptidase (beta-lactamase class C family)